MSSSSPARGPLNGRRYGSDVAGLAIAGAGAASSYDDPMSKVLGLDAKTSGFGAWFGFTSGSTVLLAAFMAFATFVAWMHANRARTAASAPEEIEVMKEDVPPPPPPPPTAEAKPEPAPPPRAQPHEPPPPPAPAQAAKVLAQEPDPNEPVDLTGNTIVQGNAESYAGGFTAGNGKSAAAVQTAPSPTGVAGGTGPVTGPDRSRKCGNVGSSEWNAPFPPEADAAQIDEAYVTLQVDVRPDGSPGAVKVASDPGNGFGREARRYALTKRYQAGLDHDGAPIPCTFLVKVHFNR